MSQTSFKKKTGTHKFRGMQRSFPGFQNPSWARFVAKLLSSSYQIACDGRCSEIGLRVIFDEVSLTYIRMPRSQSILSERDMVPLEKLVEYGMHQLWGMGALSSKVGFAALI